MWLAPVLATAALARPFEVALGGSWIPDRVLATPGTVDAHVGWLPRPELGLDLGASLGVRGLVEPLRPIARVGVTGDVPALRDDLRHAVTWTLQLAPISGEVRARAGTVGLRGYFLAGAAAVSTVDDIDGALEKAEDPAFLATELQTHPALVWGGGLRLALTPRIGARLQVDSLRWVEVYESVVLVNAERLGFSLLATASL